MSILQLQVSQRVLSGSDLNPIFFRNPKRGFDQGNL